MDTLEFLKPGRELRGKPFWCWNGVLEKEMLLRQIEVFKAMGMGGVFLHSRTGLETEYLGEEWFDCVNACADKAQTLGLETWLYDEDRWPSGVAGGKVTEHEAYRMKFLRVKVIPSTEYGADPLPDRLLAVYSVNMQGKVYTDAVRLADGEKPAGNTVLIFSVEPMQNSPTYNGYTYVDTMNQEATEQFLTQTHRQYQKHCGERLGKSIRGIFTDEPHRGSLMCGFSVDNADPIYLTPYTDDLFEVFLDRMGYSLEERLPELFFFPEQEGFSRVKYDYVELLEELFMERFIMPIARWCRENNMLFTGHMLHEDWPAAQVCMAGSLMRIYEQMDIPGMDVLERNNRGYWIAKQLQSVARQTGKTRTISEMFGVTGWQLTFTDHKAICDWQLLFGVNLRCQHLAWYTMRGEAKRDYPASIFFQSYWHKRYGYMEDYFSRIAYFREQGDPLCELLVISPLESLWGKISPGWANDYLHAVDAFAKRHEEEYKRLFGRLCAARIDFDYGDEEMIGRLGNVREKAFHVGQAHYRAVLLPPLETVRSTTLSLLEDFLKNGGRVVALEKLPAYVDGVYAPEKVTAKLSGTKLCTWENVIPVLGLEPPLDIFGEDGATLDKVFLQTNRDDNTVTYMLLNTDEENACRLMIGKRPFRFLEKWDPRTGKTTTVSRDAEKTVAFTLPPAGELLLAATAVDHGFPEEPVLQFAGVLPTPQADGYAYTLCEENVCVLDHASYVWQDESSPDSIEVLKLDDLLRKRCSLPERGGQMVQPWYRHLHGDDTESGIRTPLAMTFSFEMAYIPETIQLVMETPEQFTVMINGEEDVLSPAEGFWVDNCFQRFNIPVRCLRKGVNTITLKTLFGADSNLENIYLLGDFGVRVEGRTCTIIPLPERLQAGDIGSQGLPFYGGGLVYTVPCPKPREGARLLMKLADSRAAAYTVKAGGQEQMVAFAPWEADVTENDGTVEVEYLFTRRNTFGPFHQFPPDENNCNPTSFRSEDREYYADGMICIPQGMMKDVCFEEIL
ncbi:MAG: hypothetical protein IJT66_01145 [Clostridia bacterium]|nr:hypothetical protein [Clostridia bacterium]